LACCRRFHWSNGGLTRRSTRTRLARSEAWQPGWSNGERETADSDWRWDLFGGMGGRIIVGRVRLGRGARRRVGGALCCSTAQRWHRRLPGVSSWRCALSDCDALLPQTAGRGLALSLLGAVIGLGIGLVSEILKHGWLMVIRSQSRNAPKARVSLVKAKIHHRRAEESDVGYLATQPWRIVTPWWNAEGKVFSGAWGRASTCQSTICDPAVNSDRRPSEVGGTLCLFRDRVGLILIALL